MIAAHIGEGIVSLRRASEGEGDCGCDKQSFHFESSFFANRQRITLQTSRAWSIVATASATSGGVHGAQMVDGFVGAPCPARRGALFYRSSFARIASRYECAVKITNCTAYARLIAAWGNAAKVPKICSLASFGFA